MLTQSTAAFRWLKLLAVGVIAAAVGFLFAHTTLILVVFSIPSAAEGVEIPFWGFMAISHILCTVVITAGAAAIYIYSRSRFVTIVFWVTAIVAEAVIGFRAIQ